MDAPSPDRSLQETYFPDLTCFGCGPANERGLQLRSFAGPAEAVTAMFRPQPHHDNGLGYLNGGIITTVLDCHGAAAVTHRAHQQGWLTEGVALPYVTAGVEVRFRRPTPLDAALELSAELIDADDNEMHAHSVITYDGKVRAEMTSTWKRWRPR